MEQQIEKLIKQRQAIDAEISDVKTRDIKQAITELEANSRTLLTKVREAKARRLISDEEISKQMRGHYSEIEKLKNLSVSNIYFSNKLQAEINENAQKIADFKGELGRILNDDSNSN